MFLAWKEIRHEKLRYGLIVFMIFFDQFFDSDPIIVVRWLG
jgi:hypothetical protein